MKWALPGLVVAGACLASAEPPSSAVTLGGSRRIEGTVAQSGSDYLVTVRFRPVQVFDAATNDEINRELGREYVLRVLAKHVASKSDLEFETSRLVVVQARQVQERFEVEAKLPRSAMTIVPERRVEKDGGRRVSPAMFSNAFFTAKQNHLDMLAALVARNQDWIRRARADADAMPPAGRRRVLAKGIVAVEERGLAAFRTLEQSVETDANLLNLTERPEVLRAVRADRDAFVAALKSALMATGDARQAFREVAIEKPFDVYLKQHPFVMEFAGAVLVEPEPGQWLLIGVGKTLLKDDSVEELLRAERVCTLKARAAAIGERDGSVVTHLKRVEDRILVVTDDAGREKAVAVSERLKITQEKVEGIAKNLPVVGRWRSENGKHFYLAVGGKIPADLLPKRE